MDLSDQVAWGIAKGVLYLAIGVFLVRFGAWFGGEVLYAFVVELRRSFLSQKDGVKDSVRVVLVGVAMALALLVSAVIYDRVAH